MYMIYTHISLSLYTASKFTNPTDPPKTASNDKKTPRMDTESRNISLKDASKTHPKHSTREDQ